jgi:hypothetical protein
MKTVLAQGYSNQGTASNLHYLIQRVGSWRTYNQAITAILLFPTAGNFIASSEFHLYGVPA